jgi:hypothetical protein
MSSVLTGFIGDEQAKRELETYLSKANSEIGALGIGKMRVFEGRYNNNGMRYIGYNDDMIKYATVPLSQGNWIEKNDSHEIPIIVGGAFRYDKNTRVGDVLQLKLQAGSEREYSCRVTGILNNNDMYFDISYGATDPSLYSIAIIYQWMVNTFDDGLDYIVIYPFDSIESNTEAEYSPGQLLFFEKNIDATALTKELNTGKRYGVYSLFSDMTNEQIARSLRLNNDSIVMSIALFLFCLFGLGGFSILSNVRNKRLNAIYRICGMTKTYAMVIKLSAIFMIVAFPAAISLINLPNRLDNFAMLTWPVYIAFAAALLLILIPSILLIASESGSSYDLRRD